MSRSASYWNAVEVPLRRLRQFQSAENDCDLRHALMNVIAFPADAPLEPPRQGLLIIASGWARSLKFLSDGRQQILSLILPGDIVGEVEDDRARPSRLVRSITSVHACDATPLMRLDEEGRRRYPGLLRGVQQLQVEMDALVDDQVIRLGVLNAYERVGHLFSEVFSRLAAVGLTNGDQFLMPLTQERLGEMLGLSETHVNRTLRQLRQDGLLAVGPGWFALPDRGRLAARVGFHGAAGRVLQSA